VFKEWIKTFSLKIGDDRHIIEPLGRDFGSYKLSKKQFERYIFLRTVLLNFYCLYISTILFLWPITKHLTGRSGSLINISFILVPELIFAWIVTRKAAETNLSISIPAPATKDFSYLIATMFCLSAAISLFVYFILTTIALAHSLFSGESLRDQGSLSIRASLFGVGALAFWGAAKWIMRRWRKGKVAQLADRGGN